MFTGKTKNLAVIGSPIEHSLSPAMQNAAIRAAGLDYAYVALPVLPERLEDGVRGLRALGFRGFNVTIPHKSAILPLLDEADEAARAIGAVNTVVCEAGRLKGFNTDVEGFLGALAARGFSVEGKRVVLLGAGGAARAALYGLLRSGAAEVTLGVRNAPKARPLAEERNTARFALSTGRRRRSRKLSERRISSSIRRRSAWRRRRRRCRPFLGRRCMNGRFSTTSSIRPRRRSSCSVRSRWAARR